MQSETTFHHLGQLHYQSRFVNVIDNIDRVEESLVTRGAFHQEDEDTYEVLLYLSTLAEWEAYWAKESVYYEPPEDSLLGAIRTGLALEGLQLVQKLQVKALRFGIP